MNSIKQTALSKTIPSQIKLFEIEGQLSIPSKRLKIEMIKIHKPVKQIAFMMCREKNDGVIFGFSISSIFADWVLICIVGYFESRHSARIDAKYKLWFSLIWGLICICNLAQKRAQLDVIWRKISVYIWVLICIVGNFKITTSGSKKNMQRFLNISKVAY